MRTIYIAFDDTEFDNEKACLEYEAILREIEEGYDPVDKYCKFAADDVYVYDGEWVSTIEQMGECLSILERFGGKQC